MTEPVLDVRNLVVEFRSDDGAVRAVDERELLGRPRGDRRPRGESGAGKTLTSEAVLGLVRCPPGRVSGEVRFRGQNLLASTRLSSRASGARRSR